MRPPGRTSGAARSSVSACSFSRCLQRAGPHPPFGVRIAPPGADAGAGASISTRSILPCRSASSLPTDFGGAHLDVARAGALQPRHGSARAGACRRRWRRSGPCSPSWRRARASCRRRRRRDRSPARRAWRREQRGELRAFVLNFDQALEIGELGMHRRAFGVGPELDAQAEAATSGSARAQDRRASAPPPRASLSACWRADRAARARRAPRPPRRARRRTRGRDTDRAIPG